MTEWPNVRWTKARQVTRLMGVRDSDAPDEQMPPEQWCAALRDGGQLDEALSFIGHALPRFEGVAWAAAAVERMRGRGEAGDDPTMAAIRSWVSDPDDKGRRAIWTAADGADDQSPERLLAYAVFLSGGSISAEDQPAVNPQPELSGRLAAAAVITAAYRTADPPAALAEALAAGEAAARGNG
jgi:hypothetical protein